MFQTKRVAAKERQEAVNTVDGKLVECNEAYTKGAFNYLRFLVHLLGVGQFTYALYYWCNNVKIPPHLVDVIQEDWGGKLKFLTFLDVILQAIYHSIALLNDIFGSNYIEHSASKLRKIKDFMFAAWAFPTSLNVCVSFWVIYAFDRELIFPTVLDAFFPNALNHVIHTNIAMFIILDMFTNFRQYPRRKTGLAGTSIFMFLYIIWLHITRYYGGRWAYPLFDVLNLPMRYLMMTGLLLFSVILYFVGEFANNVIWTPELNLLERKFKLKLK